MPRGFAAQDGKGIDQIREMAEVIGWEVFKDKKGAGKFIFVDSDYNALIIKHEGKIGALFDLLQKNGLEKYVKKHKIEESDRTTLIGEKRIRISRARIKEQQKEALEQAEKLNARKTEITLKIMSGQFPKGTPERMKLREELHAIVDELKAIGMYECGGMSSVSHEDLALARKRGEGKKKERKEKKEARKKGVPR